MRIQILKSTISCSSQTAQRKPLSKSPGIFKLDNWLLTKGYVKTGGLFWLKLLLSVSSVLDHVNKKDY